MPAVFGVFSGGPDKSASVRNNPDGRRPRPIVPAGRGRHFHHQKDETMGYYIEGPTKGKSAFLVMEYGAVRPSDGRKKVWLLMDRLTAEKLTGFGGFEQCK